MDVLESDWHLLFDESPEKPVPLGQVTDSLNGIRWHSDMDELLESSVRSDHPDRSVSCPDEVNSGFNDSPKDDGQVQLSRDDTRRTQQGSQATLRLEHILGGTNELLDDLFQLRSREIRKTKRCRSVIAHCDPLDGLSGLQGPWTLPIRSRV